MKRIRLILAPFILMVMFTSPTILGEVKKLTCELKDPIGLEIVDRLYAGQEFIYLDAIPIGPNIFNQKKYCENYGDTEACLKLEELKEKLDICASRPYLAKYEFIFDTEELEEGTASFRKDICGQDPDSREYTAEMSASPTMITLMKVRSSNIRFTIDRQSLRAGYGSDRYFECSIGDIDVSKNKI